MILIDSSSSTNSTDFFRHTGTFAADANTIEANRTSFSYASNSPHNGNIIHFDAKGYGTQINTSYGDGNAFSFRTRNGDDNVWNPWRKVWHDGNFNPANYLPLSGGSLSGGLNGTSATFSSSVTASGFFQSSDIRLKNVVERNYQKDNITDIKAISYYWKDSSRGTEIQLGYSAQDVQKIIPQAVNEDKNGELSVNYIQVLIAKIEALENIVNELKHK